ncbi:MAG: hypothetical protein ACD_60C00132G0011 [uncultured bacterium]|nr:MAG: hypothetical protein ACD_60C00132G0011 [uncultured bacterium]
MNLRKKQETELFRNNFFDVGKNALMQEATPFLAIRSDFATRLPADGMKVIKKAQMQQLASQTPHAPLNQHGLFSGRKSQPNTSTLLDTLSKAFRGKKS